MRVEARAPSNMRLRGPIKARDGPPRPDGGAANGTAGRVGLQGARLFTGAAGRPGAPGCGAASAALVLVAGGLGVVGMALAGFGFFAPELLHF